MEEKYVVIAMDDRWKKVVRNVLPAIRAATVVDPVTTGASQAEAARLPWPAPPPLSGYLSGKRGCRITFGDDMKQSIEPPAQDLRETRMTNLVGRIRDSCRQLRKEREPCGCFKKPLRLVTMTGYDVRSG